MALGNSNKVVQQAIDSSTDDPLMRGIEEELALIARRRRPARNARTVVTGKYTFQKYHALPEHELEGAYPAPQKALEFLHRLAADPGIVGIMQQHQCAPAVATTWLFRHIAMPHLHCTSLQQTKLTPSTSHELTLAAFPLCFA